MPITLENIYSELIEIKNRLTVIEDLLFDEVVIGPEELEELKEISKSMKGKR